ncbi:MAG: hypothetical protein IK017_05125 [Paludibacteraceae bacterium]|nr:hypothetical protein [Paludibacteraceae bacterium]MBR5972018.1 hypothetical protein [Paludibacteraceae bacterium]
MKHSSLFLSCCILSLCMLSSCNNDSSKVFEGCSITQKPEFPTIEPVNGNGGFNIDYCNDLTPNISLLDFNNADTIRLSGWAIDQNNNTELKDIVLHIGENYIKANYGKPRTDVKEVLGCSSENVGFSFSFSKELLTDQTGFVANQIEIIKITKDGKAYSPIKFDLRKNATIPTLTERIRNEEYANGGIYVDSYTNGTSTIHIKDYAQLTMITIYGWAFDTEAKAKLDNLYLKLGNNIFTATFAERPDVQTAFGLEENNVGFICEIPAYLLKKANGEFIDKIDFIGISHSGEFIYNPKTYYLLIE